MNERFEIIMKRVLEEAEKLRINAGYQGSFTDGGASRLEAQVRFFKCGLAGQLPPEWAEYDVTADPEWATYVRLKERFSQ